jgi:hypothetical protein
VTNEQRSADTGGRRPIAETTRAGAGAVSAEAIINVWGGRKTLLRAGWMGARGPALPSRATTPDSLAFSGVAPAGAGQAHRRVPVGTRMTRSEADLAMTVRSAGGTPHYGSPVRFTATVANNRPEPAENVAVTGNFIPGTFNYVIWRCGVASCAVPLRGGYGAVVCKAPSRPPAESRDHRWAWWPVRRSPTRVTLRHRHFHHQGLSISRNPASGALRSNLAGRDPRDDGREARSSSPGVTVYPLTDGTASRPQGISRRTKRIGVARW